MGSSRNARTKRVARRPKGRSSTPPAQARIGPSPRWIPVLTVALVAAGPVAIVLNYLGFLPASPTNWYLLVGIGLIGAGVLVGTQYR